MKGMKMTMAQESIEKIRQLVDKAKEIDATATEKHIQLFHAARDFFEMRKNLEVNVKALQNLEEALTESEEFLFL